jgi:basic membrane lipoprotein Med (substrate-binding protein (PBP1-ABC) superfamily)
MKRLDVLAFIPCIALLFLASCGGGKPASGTAGGDTGKPEFKVALITPGAINDKGWSQNAYEGLQKMEKDLGAKISNTVAGSPNEAFAAFRNYASQGTNLVIGHASEWFDPELIKIGKDNPKTTFLISGSEKSEDHIAGVRFVLEDGFYVLGQIAASLSKSGTLGCVGPKEVPVIASTFYSFEEGAKSVKPDIKVVTVWTNDWADVARAKERTLILINQGCDVIIHNANDGAPGVFQAVQENKDKGVLCFGSNADQNAQADDVILASAVLDIPSAFLSIGKKVKDGTFDYKAQSLGMPEGFVWIAYNEKLAGKIPADVKKKADETVEKIKKRELVVPRKTLK